jgi:chemotaxis protein CheC
MGEYIELSDMQVDAIKEIGNVGIGNASTVLSKLIDKKVKLSFHETKFVPLEEFANFIGGPDTIVASLSVNVLGDLSGRSFLIFPKDSALLLVDVMLDKKEKSLDFDDMARSALNELGNIFVGAYLSSMANMLGIVVLPAVPEFLEDMAQSIVDSVLIDVGLYANDVLCIKTNISVEDHNITGGEFILILTPDSLTKCLNVLKEKYGY